MSSDNGRRHELEALLREPVEPLTPAPGTWEQIDRRAARRKWAKASLGVAAAVVVVAGAVPAVIAVRHTSDNQTLAIGQSSPHPQQTGINSPAPASHSPVPTSAPHFAGLTGFFPESVSFVSQSEGFLWGSEGMSHRGVVARTIDGGRTWARRPSPAVNDSFVGRHGDSQIRFASGEVGFVYGSRTFITRDGGRSWQRFATPGYIADLEAVNGRIWALVRPCETCAPVQLYSATAADPMLHRVGQVPVMHGTSGAPEVASAASIAVSGDHVDVIVGSAAFWSTTNGRVWKRRADPCPTQVDSGPVRSALVSSTTSAGVVVACGYNVNGNNETKRLYESGDSGAHWKAVPGVPSDTGYLQTLSAGGGSDIIIGTSRGGAQVSHDGGRSWAADMPNGVRLSFVGFIDPSHIVAVADRADSAIGAFATSHDGGGSWSLTSFP